ERISPVKMKVFKNSENLGISKNLNRLISLAKGNIISFMASDDRYYGKKTFSENLDKLAKNPKIQAIYTEGYIWNGKDFLGKAQGRKEVSYIKARKYKELLDYMLSNVPHLLIQGGFFRKSLLDSIKGFDENLKADDWVLNIKIIKYILNNNLEIIYNEEICFLYRKHESNTTKDLDKIYNLIQEVIISYTPFNKKKCLLARLNWRHGKRLLKFRKSFSGFKYMFSGLVSCPTYIFADILEYIQKKLNLKK
ncbi:MAG: glycosyltransferase, partial [Aquificae bacterium]|nr:glycosyltransferase [Aquificota bacterium]